MARGRIFDIQRFSIHDGPGIRTTVFLKGCPLTCAWCHNPEGQRAEPEIVVLEGLCLRCGACLAACPRGEGDPDQACLFCGLCVEACPGGARRIYGRELAAEELLDEILRDRVFYEESGGGVTFSGGEPLHQAEFLLELLASCRERGLHTALDTCGYVEQTRLLAAGGLADLVLYDLKLMDEAAHLRLTGVSNGLILSNLRALAAIHRNIWIRLPIIPGINDEPGFLRSVAGLIGPLPGVRQVHLLPYHKTGAGKFDRLGRAYALPETDPPARGRLEELAAVLEKAGLPAKIGG
jgi:pyruvate formate lyase activating enzyme